MPASTCELVIAQYGAVDELGDALDAIVPHARCAVAYVYSKSDNCSAVVSDARVRSHANTTAVQCSSLPNVGREQHVFYHHVAARYSSGFADRVHLVPLPLARHYERLLTLLTATSAGGLASSSFWCSFPEVSDPWARVPSAIGATETPLPNGWTASPQNRRSLQADWLSPTIAAGGSTLDPAGPSSFNRVFANAVRFGYPHSGGCGTNAQDPERRPCLDFYKTFYIDRMQPLVANDVEPLWAWEERHAGVRKAALANVPVCYVGVASTTRENLHARPQSVYAAFRDQLAVSDGTEAAHTGERLMAANFGPPVELWDAGRPEPAFLASPLGMLVLALGGVLALVALVILGSRCWRQARAASADEAKPLQG